MQKHLFLFTISPVQTFIEQARKTHDLYAGSRILSDLIDFAMNEVNNLDNNKEFIFPTQDQKSKPNRFIAIVHSDDMQQFGNDIQVAVDDYFVNTLGKKVIDLFAPAKAQLEDFLKIYWVAEKYDEHGDYPKQIKDLERKLGAVKNIRYFKQFSEKGRKCSMNGEYNVKFYRRGEDEANNDRLYNKKLFQARDEVKVLAFSENKKVRVSHLQTGEGLCAVSLMKRFYDNDGDNEFPSTANIALSDTLQKIKKVEKANTLIEEFTTCLGKKNERNGQLYYNENLTEEYFKKQGISEGALDCATEKLGDLVSIIKSKKLKLAKYYAILAFDADGMGKKLQKCLDAPEHTRVSKLLADFAGLASDYINDKSKSRGKTVYAGGDDFLGFINLNHLFDVMKDLRRLFDEVVNTNLRLDLQMTFSAGVAIAHYKTPLSEVLRWAKLMEKTAKKVEKSDESTKKDAFSIAALKRSGEIHYTTWRWKSENKWTTDRFKRVIRHLKEGELSKKFITNLSSEYGKRLDKDGNWGEQARKFQFITELNTMLEYELDFFISRATASDDKAKEAVKGLVNELYSNYKHHIDFELSVQNMLNMLHICEFITRELNPIISIEENCKNQETVNA